MLSTAIAVIVVMAVVGIIFGLILAIANKKFAVEVNPLIEMVDEILPKGQCGSCGYAGCKAYAEAVVLDPNVPANLCVPGKIEVAKKVGELTGKVAEEIEPMVAHVRCLGSKDKTVLNYNYEGIDDCMAASLLLGGPKGCQYGCLGFGTCVKNCPFGAMTMGDNGIPVVDREICTGCKKCQESCPKKVIEMIPKDSIVMVNCNSLEKGAVARKLCTVSCLGCGICSRSCTHGAIKVENNLAIVNSEICINECTNAVCTEKCPTKAIEIILPRLSEDIKKEESVEHKPAI